MLSRANFARMFPRASASVLDALTSSWPSVSDRFGLGSTPTRAAYFLAQMAHETLGLTVFEENLRYSAKRLTQVWPKRFPTIASAKPYALNPKALAEKVYGGRMGNGPEGAGDGYAFRGQGGLQTTGRDAFAAVGKIAGLDLVHHPELAALPSTMLLVTGAVWAWKNGNAFADRDELMGLDDDDADDFVPLTRAINGGTNGLSDRKTWLTKISPIVVEAFAAVPQASQAKTGSSAVLLTPTKHKDNAPPPKGLVVAVQEGLAKLGYHEVGNPDGSVGSRTRGAILAFQADAGLPLDPTIDTDLLAAIEKAKPREVSAERAVGKPEDSRIVASANKQLTIGGLLAGGGVLSQISDQVDQGSTALKSIKRALDPFRDLIVDYWPALLVAAGVAIAVFAWRARKARIEDYRRGKTSS